MSDDQDMFYAEIEDLKEKLSHLVENCLGAMEAKDMAQISSRMKGLLQQGIFWIKAENPQRFAYDLRDFTNWLMEFIADKERDFWNE
jgi:hypothetical protein